MQAARKHEHMEHADSRDQKMEHKMHHYRHLTIMIGVHFVVMYVLMYLMVDRFANVFLNVNNFYMSGAMAAPMAILMLIFMRSMYTNRKLNLAIYAGAAVLTLAFIFFTRQQALVGDRQFIKSMIPHHAGAILMCNKASIADIELKSLCARIAQSQQEEIDQMKVILARIQK